VDVKGVCDYVRSLFDRAERVGGKVITFASADARWVPDYFPFKRALAQLIDFLKFSADEAAERGLAIVVEPVNEMECNIINNIDDGVELVREVDKPNVGLMVDFYHMIRVGEEPEDILKAGPLMGHVHAADTGRMYPGSGFYDYPRLLSSLGKIGYDGRISFECRYDDFERDSKSALEFMRDAWKRYGAGRKGR